MKMRRCFTDPHYYKNPALRRSREKTQENPGSRLPVVPIYMCCFQEAIHTRLNNCRLLWAKCEFTLGLARTGMNHDFSWEPNIVAQRNIDFIVVRPFATHAICNALCFNSLGFARPAPLTHQDPQGGVRGRRWVQLSCK